MKKVMLVVLLSFGFAATVQASSVTFSGTGATAADIVAVRDSFRTAVGGGSAAGANGSFGGLRREINWDGVPDTFSAPNLLPANFFNVNSPRGVVFSTPGTGFQVSANAAVGVVEFGNLNAGYPGIFAAFSPQRLFTAVGSNITDVSFFVPGTSTAGVTSAFGSVFTDVDLAGSSIEYFDISNVSLGLFSVPVLAGNESFSFLGVQFDTPVISRVRITSGNMALGTPENPSAGSDAVVMDDFLYAEPTVAPEASTVILMSVGLGALLIAGRWRKLRNQVKAGGL